MEFNVNNDGNLREIIYSKDGTFKIVDKVDVIEGVDPAATVWARPTTWIRVYTDKYIVLAISGNHLRYEAGAGYFDYFSDEVDIEYLAFENGDIRNNITKIEWHSIPVTTAIFPTLFQWGETILAGANPTADPHSPQLTSVEFMPSLNTAFCETFTHLRANIGDPTYTGVGNINSSNGTNFNSLGSNYQTPNSFDFAALDYSSGVSFDGFFSSATYLPDLSFLRAIKQPRSMSGIFKILDLGGADLNVANIFDNATSLAEGFERAKVNIIGFKTNILSSLTTIKSLFERFEGMDTIDLSGIDFSEVTNASYLCNAAVVKDIIMDNVNLDKNETYFDAFSSMPTLENISFTGSIHNSLTLLKTAFRNTNSPQGEYDLRGLDVSKVTQFSEVFSLTKNKAVDIRGWNTVSATSFYKFLSRSEIAVRGMEDLNLSNVTSAYEMCRGLSTYNSEMLDTTGWGVGTTLTDVRSMFMQLENVSGIDLTGWITTSFRDLSSFLTSGYNKPLSQIIGMETWDLSQATSLHSAISYFKYVVTMKLPTMPLVNWNGYRLFTGMEGLECLDKLNTTKCTNKTDMFKDVTPTQPSPTNKTKLLNPAGFDWVADGECEMIFEVMVTSAVGYDPVVTGGTIYKYDNGDGTWSYKSKNYLTSFRLGGGGGSPLTGVTSVTLIKSKIGKLTSLSALFYSCPDLETVYVLPEFDTSAVTDYTYSFEETGNVDVDLSLFDFSSAIALTNMFNQSGMKNIDLSGADLSKVIGMDSFAANSQVETVSLAGCDLRSLTNFNFAFGGSNLKTISFAGADMSGAIAAQGIFYGATFLKCVDYFDTRTFTNTTDMFTDTSSLVFPSAADILLLEAGAEWTSPMDCSDVYLIAAGTSTADVPTGKTVATVCMIGGGAGGSSDSSNEWGGSAGNIVSTTVAVVAGETLSLTVGAGALDGNNGGASIVTALSGTLTAAGGTNNKYEGDGASTTNCFGTFTDGTNYLDPPPMYHGGQAGFSNGADGQTIDAIMGGGACGQHTAVKGGDGVIRIIFT